MELLFPVDRGLSMRGYVQFASLVRHACQLMLADGETREGHVSVDRTLQSY